MFYREIGGLRVSALGYGCMRFPTKDGHIDEPEAEALLKRAYEAGVNYFDTAYNYHSMESEPFVGRFFSRLPRETFFLATKFPSWKAETLEEAKDIFEFQMKNLRTDHIDFYLIHSLDKERWDKINRIGIPQLLQEYQRQGRIVKLGFSFHDSYEAFEEILRARKWDFCQIQFNYMDTDVQAGEKGLLLAQDLNVSVIVMEPVKGGALATLPEDVAAPFRALSSNDSNASWALRFAESYENVKVILSGMSTMEQVENNLATMSEPKPLNEAERKAVDKVVEALRARTKNGCTGCRYCMPCPNGVDIPRLFHIWNEHGRYASAEASHGEYIWVPAEARADRCVECGACVPMCPQSIDIPGDLRKVASEPWTNV
jgi:predicted aldo/keto reductase-like oxidoreductase